MTHTFEALLRGELFDAYMKLTNAIRRKSQLPITPYSRDSGAKNRYSAILICRFYLPAAILSGYTPYA